MNIEELRDYCLSKKGTEETFPFDEVTLVFKVMGKMYALIGLDRNLAINLKCNPEKAIELREEYSAVIPGYHMNKKHWNTINIDDSIPASKIHEWIDHSYDLIIKSLPKALKQEWERLE